MSDWNQDQKARESFVEVQKRKQGLLPDTPVPERKPPEKPKGFKAKWANYWYHYKAVTIIGILVVLVLGFATYDMLTRTHYDLTVILATKSHYISEEDQDYLIKKLTPMTPDLTENGKVDICIINIYGAGKDMVASQRLVATLNSGESALIISDDEVYDTYFKGQAGLVDLQKRYGSSPLFPDPCRFTLNGSTLTAGTNQKDVLNTLSFSIRDLSKFPGNDKTQGKAAYQATLKIMDALMKEQKA